MTAAKIETRTTFRFNGQYDDLVQVVPYLPAFEARLRELTEEGTYRYNSCFEGHVPGIEGPDEETAIYLLQGLERRCRECEQVSALLADGYSFISRLDKPTKFSHVVLVPTGRMHGEWSEYHDARVIPETKPEQIRATGKLRAVMPKGNRTTGYLVNTRRVLVKC